MTFGRRPRDLTNDPPTLALRGTIARPQRSRAELLLWAVLVVSTASLSTLFYAAETATAAGYKRCADVIIRNGDGGVYTRTRGLFHLRASCRTARTVARRYLSGIEGNAGLAPRPLGFRCSGGQDGVACKKGRQRVTWGYYQD